MSEKSLIDMDVEHTCRLGGMNATHYCSEAGRSIHSMRRLLCDTPLRRVTTITRTRTATDPPSTCAEPRWTSSQTSSTEVG